MGAPTVEHLDDQRLGLRAHDSDDLPLDVLLDDQRVWSFWLLRDTQPGGPGEAPGTRTVEWPRPLRPHLRGAAVVRVAEHVSGRVLLEQEHVFAGGADGQRLRVVDAQGNPLGIDKSGRLTKTFEHRGAEHVGPLMDAVDRVLEALRQVGAEPFVAYGTLLGAVREGGLIGHDSDADLGYVSRHGDPLDVCRESFDLQRGVSELGFRTQRYSGASFKVLVPEADGQLRGLDVFGGFLDDTGSDGQHGDPTLYLMGEVGMRFREEWIFPLGTARMEGRPVPVPAQPEKLLEAMYGPAWRVPDPAFQFSTPDWVQRALNGWFRGTRVNRDPWARRYSGTVHKLPTEEPSDLARLVLAETSDDTHVADLGTGRGVDALFWARQGRSVAAYDHMTSGAVAVRDRAKAEGLALELCELNLCEWRSAVAVGLREGYREGPKVLVARHLADSVPAFARDALWRLAGLALRGGGRLYLEDWVDGGKPQHPGHHRMATSTVVDELVARGAEIVSAEERQEPLDHPQDPLKEQSMDAGEVGATRTVSRVVARWRA